MSPLTRQPANEPQAATSTILRHFLTLSESVSAETKLEWQDDEHKLHVNVPGLFKPQDEEGVKYMSQMLRYLKEKEIYTFSFVRHPFERSGMSPTQP